MSSAVITRRMFRWNRQKERGLKGEDRKKAGEQKEKRTQRLNIDRSKSSRVKC